MANITSPKKFNENTRVLGKYQKQETHFKL